MKALIVAAAVAHGVSAAAMDGLVGCETGRTYDPHIVSRDGRYVGLTQLDGRHLARLHVWAEDQGIEPDEFDPAQQLNYTIDYLAVHGAGEWPVCGRGLSFLPPIRTFGLQ